MNDFDKKIPSAIVRGAGRIRRLVAGLYRGDPELVYGISDMDMLERWFPEFVYSSANPSRVAAGVHSRFLYTGSCGATYSRSDHLLLRESRYLSAEVVRPYVDLTIAGTTVVKLDEVRGDMVARVFNDAAMAGVMRLRFDELWWGVPSPT